MIYYITYNNKRFKCIFTETNVHIENSYELTNKQDIANFIKEVIRVANHKGLTYKRTEKSWIKEWVAHNIFYKLGLFRKRTRSVDLSENEGKLKLFCYNLLTFYI